MRKFGLIGYPLTHSFSKKYFSEKFRQQGIHDALYELYELPDLQEFPRLWSHVVGLVGLNVTIPYKEAVIPFLDDLAPSAQKVGAVNVIRREADGALRGYNSDYDGFRRSLLRFLPEGYPGKALVLGTGGASRAVRAVLEEAAIPYLTVSRQLSKADLVYPALTSELMQTHRLVVNTTPLGTWPDVRLAPELPYEEIGPDHFVYDLVYNPEETELMRRAKMRGAQTKNGLEMLHLQAERAWEIWNTPAP